MITNQKIRSVLTAAVLVLSLPAAWSAHASVVIGGTRVVYNANEKEATIKLSNQGNAPALTQAWLDNGDPKAAPSTVEVPFLVTPPVMRIDPKKAQTLRILHTGEPLPQDKESVFWLNVLEIPPKAEASGANTNHLQLAFRSRIKMFYRPANLKGSALDAPGQVAWRLVASGNQFSLEARNPASYHVSFTALEVKGSDGKVASFDDGGMVNPGETQVFPLKGDVTQSAAPKVHYTALNDHGGAVTGEAAATH